MLLLTTKHIIDLVFKAASRYHHMMASHTTATRHRLAAKNNIVRNIPSFGFNSILTD